MKIVLILAGVGVLAIFLLINFFSSRLGKAVNPTVSDSYYFDPQGKKIIYSPMGNWFELGYKETGADAKSFVALSRDAGKDDHAVYWKGIKTQADAPTFFVDSNSVLKDKLHVYFPVKDYPPYLFVIAGADPKTYQPLPVQNNLYYYYWGSDSTSIFLDGIKVDVDKEAFVRLNASLAIDAHYVYSIEFSGNLAAGKPGATTLVKRIEKPTGKVEVININYVQIGHSVVFSNWKNKFSITPFDKIKSIKQIDETNILINGMLVRDGKILEGIDEASLEIINHNFFKDKNNVYYDSEKILLANTQTFNVVFDLYSKDDEHVFYKQNLLEAVNPHTFTYNYASGIATDGKLSFKDGQLLTEKN